MSTDFEGRLFRPKWQVKTGSNRSGRTSALGQTIVVGIQHVVAMFGSTALAPIIMGFYPNVSILFWGSAL